MKNFQYIILIFFFLLAGQSIGQLNAPKYSNEFLNLGVSAKAFGMSNAVVASVDDASAGYWNPSGLMNMKKNMQVEVMHAEYFAGIANYDYVGFAKKINEDQVIGVSALRFGVDNILNTTELIDNNGNVDYDRIKLFSAADYAFLFSYAKSFRNAGKQPNPTTLDKQRLQQGLTIGGNAKIIHRKIGDFANAWGFGFDLSAQYRLNQWSFGAVARDVTSTFNAWNYTLDEQVIEVFENTGNELPENSIEVTLPKLILGAARTFKVNKDITILTELDMDFSFDGERNSIVSSNFATIDPHFGVDASYQNTVFLRMGVGNFQYQQNFLGEEDLTLQPNIGIGLRIRQFYLDYALSDVSNQSIALYSNVFSLRMEL